MRATLASLMATLAYLVLTRPISFNNDLEGRRLLSETCPLVKKPPTGSICSEPGILKGAQMSHSTIARFCTTETECRVKCHADRICKSFSFESDGATCIFYSKSLAQQAFHGDKSIKVVFSDRTCSKCNGCAVTLLNGNFESGKINPWVAVGSPGFKTRIVSPGVLGSKYAAAITLPPAATNSQTFAYFYQNVTWCAHQSIAFSYYQHLIEGTTNNFIQAIDGEAFGPSRGSNVGEIGDEGPSKHWMQYSNANYPTGSIYGFVQFSMFNYGNTTETFAFDNIVLSVAQ